MSYSLMEVAAQVTRWTVPPIIILGVTSNILNIIILRGNNLKHHSCSLFFVTLSINNLFYSTFCTSYNLLADGYHIDLAVYSNVFCKLSSYILNLCPFISVFMLVLASIDRYCSSSLNIERRRLSNIRSAKWSILIVLMFVSIFMVGTIVMFNVQKGDTFVCSSSSNQLFNQIFLIMEVILYVMISPFLMILFGLLTILNINKSRRNHAVVFRHRNERQLARMLILQVSTHIVLILPFCVMFFLLIIPIPFRSSIMFYFLFTLFKIPFYISFITPFFLYILSAKLYRDELILLLKKICRFHRNRVVHPITAQAGVASINASLKLTYQNRPMITKIIQ